MVLDPPIADLESPDGWLERDCVSRRASMRFANDCRVARLRSETLGEGLSAIGLGDVPAPMRLPMPLVGPEPGILLPGVCKDLSAEELRLSGVIVLPMERSFIEGVRLGCCTFGDG